jgi:hypothetical protein
LPFVLAALPPPQCSVIMMIVVSLALTLKVTGPAVQATLVDVVASSLIEYPVEAGMFPTWKVIPVLLPTGTIPVFE